MQRLNIEIVEIKSLTIGIENSGNPIFLKYKIGSKIFVFYFVNRTYLQSEVFDSNLRVDIKWNLVMYC